MHGMATMLRPNRDMQQISETNKITRFKIRTAWPTKLRPNCDMQQILRNSGRHWVDRSFQGKVRQLWPILLRLLKQEIQGDRVQVRENSKGRTSASDAIEFIDKTG